MRAYLTIFLGELDHPHVKVEVDEETAQPCAVIALDETISISGELHTIRRWVDELQLRVATS
jgi:hypothetical protein